MRIHSIKTFVAEKLPRTPVRIALGGNTATPSIIVRIETDEGLCGFGEASPFAPVTGVDVAETLCFLTSMGTELPGKDALAIERIHAFMDGATPGHLPGKAAIDIALFDILAKRAGLPLYRLLGGSSPVVESDMTIGIDEPQVMAARAQGFARQGFTILKIKVGINPADDLEAVRLIREAVGPLVSLRLDANQGWQVKQTVQTMRAMERYGVDEIEQPLPAAELDGLRFVRERIAQDVMLDESVHSPADALHAICAGAADIINIKLMKSGGLLPAGHINAVAQAAGIPCMIGCMSEVRVGIAAAAAFAASTKNIRYVDLDSHLSYDEIDGIDGGFEQDGPRLQLLDTPGLGVEVNLDFS
jgi:L-alanine-DL-glutamate epimerase-like enolase superfamily enzyme